MCRAYLASLLDYLQSFHQRTQPLQSLAKQLARLEEEFDAQWEAGTVPGWSDSEPSATANGAATVAGALDVDAFDIVEELEQLGDFTRRINDMHSQRCDCPCLWRLCWHCLSRLHRPTWSYDANTCSGVSQHVSRLCAARRTGAERLKEALQALGLKAGGTLRQRAERLMLTKDTPLHELDRKHFAPGSTPAVRPALTSCCSKRRPFPALLTLCGQGLRQC